LPVALFVVKKYYGNTENINDQIEETARAIWFLRQQLVSGVVGEKIIL